MGSSSARGAVVEGVVSAAVVTLWYAMPDVVRSRRWRGVLKTGLLVAGGAYGAARGRAEDTAGRGRAEDTAGRGRAEDTAGRGAAEGVETSARERIEALTSTVPVLDAASAGLDAGPRRSRTRTLALGAAAAVGVVATVAVTVAMERAIFRWGERRRARGVRAPHTTIGVVSGLVAGALGLASTWYERSLEGDPSPTA
ncbi:hypothetical protein ICW40_05810 [Actinotalea ferrariae]|uniref:hypothetical protein n=1 Tax=Actinotalea ferrariae TaxID=1386098 RepID=UPI001C8B1026|nr:hypothetical protein [Actinotalea ferrariae]MBX9244322.1 hypothetical protein [Actinotalea ferrariae]